MSNFYGEITSDKSKTPAKKGGNKWLNAHIRTWEAGIEIDCISDGETNQIQVYLTGGSDNASRRKVLLQLNGPVSKKGK